MKKIRLNSQQFKGLVAECVKRTLNESIVDMPDDADTDYWRAEDAEGDLDDFAQFDDIEQNRLNGDYRYGSIRRKALFPLRKKLGNWHAFEHPKPNSVWYTRLGNHSIYNPLKNLDNGYFIGKQLSALPKWFHLERKYKNYADPNKDKYEYSCDIKGLYFVYTEKGTDIIVDIEKYHN